jgi:glycosyltransferase involved in cell wall biosynthesis
MNKALFVAYQYPPEASSSGVLRPLKFSRYLAEFGWNVAVLTAREEDYPRRDDSLKAQIPDAVSLYRAFCPDSRRYLSVKGKSLSIFSFPDRYVGWLPFAYRRGMEAVRREHPRLIWSTSPLSTTNLVAYLLKQRTGLPWIADFRDPWVDNSLSGWKRTGNCFLERKVMHGADGIVVTTDWMKEDLLNRIPDLDGGKIHVIYNGYDESDFDGLAAGPRAEGEPFRLVYTGGLHPLFRNPEPLFQAVAKLRDEGALPAEGIALDFYGCSDYLSADPCREAVRRLGLDEVVRDRGRVSHRESLQVLFDADALILLQDSEITRPMIPAKAFEYLRVGRPVLSLTSEGATADLVERFPQVSLVREAREPDLIAQGLHALLERSAGNYSDCRNDLAIKRYERKSLAVELAQLMNRVAEGGR